MKIYFIDYPNKKISRDHEAWWLSQGHEVKYDMYFDIEKAKWADVVICFWCEGQAGELARAKKSGEVTAKAIVQMVDIDVYQGPWRGWLNDPTDGNLWQYIDKVVFMAQHIKDYVLRDLKDVPVVRDAMVIPLPIDMHKFTYKERTPGNNIAFIAHRWSSKGIPMLYQWFAEMLVHQPELQLNIVGTKSNEGWLHEYLDHISKELKIDKNLHIQESVPDMNVWLEDKNYLVSFSYKDAFSLVVGEAMAKGIKVFMHNWWGSKAIWREEDIWTTLHELTHKFLSDKYESNKYRSFMADNYSMDKVMPMWDAILK